MFNLNSPIYYEEFVDEYYRISTGLVGKIPRCSPRELNDIASKLQNLLDVNVIDSEVPDDGPISWHEALSRDRANIHELLAKVNEQLSIFPESVRNQGKEVDVDNKSGNTGNSSIVVEDMNINFSGTKSTMSNTGEENSSIVVGDMNINFSDTKSTMSNEGGNGVAVEDMGFGFFTDNNPYVADGVQEGSTNKPIDFNSIFHGDKEVVLTEPEPPLKVEDIFKPVESDLTPPSSIPPVQPVPPVPPEQERDTATEELVEETEQGREPVEESVEEPAVEQAQAEESVGYQTESSEQVQEEEPVEEEPEEQTESTEDSNTFVTPLWNECVKVSPDVVDPKTMGRAKTIDDNASFYLGTAFHEFFSYYFEIVQEDSTGAVVLRAPDGKCYTLECDILAEVECREKDNSVRFNSTVVKINRRFYPDGSYAEGAPESHNGFRISAYDKIMEWESKHHLTGWNSPYNNNRGRYEFGWVTGNKDNKFKGPKELLAELPRLEMATIGNDDHMIEPSKRCLVDTVTSTLYFFRRSMLCSAYPAKADDKPPYYHESFVQIWIDSNGLHVNGNMDNPHVDEDAEPKQSIMDVLNEEPSKLSRLFGGLKGLFKR